MIICYQKCYRLEWFRTSSWLLSFFFSFPSFSHLRPLALGIMRFGSPFALEPMFFSEPKGKKKEAHATNNNVPLGAHSPLARIAHPAIVAYHAETACHCCLSVNYSLPPFFPLLDTVCHQSPNFLRIMASHAGEAEKGNVSPGTRSSHTRCSCVPSARSSLVIGADFYSILN